ncbi:hypothetical protein SAMD00019534_066130 [Acytostelium subglobosum LB1]|uniref:hypothetical protein n=1 Tax=Acytostelium subglobosum LB1 TaxID=1410327 RepID=UPI000644C573|nr:hypothetical protein SAMD00019534_066130 [Acytostelium subglobosum LB1]GAM23438.1 hypothetical protein SAMD00019534_066130 [Acytostelium subglobosum LB1]|eukprot:XP_012753887.1 hypothetical protein SAMD00019534_066130 [Acytostelium subglobosum LB1]
MNSLYVANLDKKRQTAVLVYRNFNNRLSSQELNEMIQYLRSELNIRGCERIKNDLRGFIKTLQANSYAKFRVVLDHDAHVLNMGGSGCLGYVSEHIYDYYDTFEFKDVEVYTPSSAEHLTVESLAERFHLSALAHAGASTNNKKQHTTTPQHHNNVHTSTTTPITINNNSAQQHPTSNSPVHVHSYIHNHHHKATATANQFTSPSQHQQLVA